MTIPELPKRPLGPIGALPVLVFILLLLVPDPSFAQRRGHGRRSMFYYSSPASVLRGQLALEREDDLERGKYEPGGYDLPTRDAIRKFQRRHHLWTNGRFDRDTYAVLPIDDRPDEDDDGIPDPDDRCPETKKGARVDFDGCPLEGISSNKTKD